MEDKKEKKYDDVPFYIHEAVCNKIERIEKKLLIISMEALLTSLV